MRDDSPRQAGGSRRCEMDDVGLLHSHQGLQSRPSRPSLDRVDARIDAVRRMPNGGSDAGSAVGVRADVVIEKRSRPASCARRDVIDAARDHLATFLPVRSARRQPPPWDGSEESGGQERGPGERPENCRERASNMLSAAATHLRRSPAPAPRPLSCQPCVTATCTERKICVTSTIRSEIDRQRRGRLVRLVRRAPIDRTLRYTMFARA